jgi:hypothetical protein
VGAIKQSQATRLVKLIECFPSPTGKTVHSCPDFCIVMAGLKTAAYLWGKKKGLLPSNRSKIIKNQSNWQMNKTNDCLSKCFAMALVVFDAQEFNIRKRSLNSWFKARPSHAKKWIVTVLSWWYQLAINPWKHRHVDNIGIQINNKV